jgi:hypothetical protein
MGRRFTARIPDGTESRVAWVLWIVGAFIFAATVQQVVFFLDAFVQIARDLSGIGLGSFAVDIAVSVVETALVGWVVLVCVRFASRRLLMPREAWLAIAAAPALTWLLLLLSYQRGFLAPYFTASVMTLGVAIAWLVERRDADSGASAHAPRELA